MCVTHPLQYSCGCEGPIPFIRKCGPRTCRTPQHLSASPYNIGILCDFHKARAETSHGIQKNNTESYRRDSQNRAQRDIQKSRPFSQNVFDKCFGEQERQDEYRSSNNQNLAESEKIARQNTRSNRTENPRDRSQSPTRQRQIEFLGLGALDPHCNDLLTAYDTLTRTINNTNNVSDVKGLEDDVLDKLPYADGTRGRRMGRSS